MKDREIKHFFRSATNVLNKGHLEQSTQETRNSIRIDKILPPIEVISEYEAIYPGTLEKALAIAQKEQEHRHKMNSRFLTSSSLTRVLGQLFGAFSVASVCFIVVKLCLIGLAQNALYVAIAYFTRVVLVSIFGFYSEKHGRMHRSARYKNKGDSSSRKS
jgi:uncharacterized membrane protein